MSALYIIGMMFGIFQDYVTRAFCNYCVERFVRFLAQSARYPSTGIPIFDPDQVICPSALVLEPSLHRLGLLRIGLHPLNYFFVQY